MGGHQPGSLRRRGLIPLLLLGVACLPKAGPVEDSFAAALRAADARWEARATEGTVDGAERAYTALLAERPTSPDVLWRLSRVAWSRSWIDAGNAETWHEVGREYALRCLLEDPGVRDAVAAHGDRLDAALVEAAEVPPECAALGAAHLVALARLRGPGAALDLEDVQALLAAPDPAGAVELALAEWAEGAVPGADPDRSRAHLRRAAERAAGLPWFRAEAVRTWPDLAEALPTAPPDPAWALETAAR